MIVAGDRLTTVGTGEYRAEHGANPDVHFLLVGSEHATIHPPRGLQSENRLEYPTIVHPPTTRPVGLANNYPPTQFPEDPRKGPTQCRVLALNAAQTKWKTIQHASRTSGISETCYRYQ